MAGRPSRHLPGVGLGYYLFLYKDRDGWRTPGSSSLWNHALSDCVYRWDFGVSGFGFIKNGDDQRLGTFAYGPAVITSSWSAKLLVNISHDKPVLDCHLSGNSTHSRTCKNMNGNSIMSIFGPFVVLRIAAATA